MAGHSKFKNIMHRKGAQDKKRAKVFTRLIREITVAAKGGEDIQSNPALRLAVMNAKAANMPKDTIEKAVKRGSGGGDDIVYEEIRYEGYGPGGIAVIVDVLTDNRNRSAGEVRAAFSKFGGSLGESGSVSYMFKRIGIIRYSNTNIDSDEILEHVIESGADDVESSDEDHTIICSLESFHSVQQALASKLGDPLEATLIWQPINEIEVSDEDKVKSLVKMIDTLEDNDDVSTVSTNWIS